METLLKGVVAGQGQYMPIIPASLEAKAGELQIGGQLWFLSKTLFQNNKKKDWGCNLVVKCPWF